jgi:hypothetical protein
LSSFFAVLPNYNSLAGRDVQMADVLTVQNIGVMAALIIGRESVIRSLSCIVYVAVQAY